MLLVKGVRRTDMAPSGTWNAGEPRVCPENRANYPWATVGMAFDYEMRFFLGKQDLHQLVAYSGAQVLATWWGLKRDLPRGFVELLSHITALEKIDRNWAKASSPEGKRVLAQVSYALALYEQCFRAHIANTWPLVQLGRRTSLKKLFASFPDDALDDLTKLIGLFVETQPDLPAARELVFNPTFDASILLGGADGDLIVDGRLLDIKTKSKGDITKTDFWQILGYVLSDFSDEYGIIEVGFYLSRHGIQVAWDVGTLMELMSGAPQDLNTMRQRFQETLERLWITRKVARKIHESDEKPKHW
jgi:hypothetical protein